MLVVEEEKLTDQSNAWDGIVSLLALMLIGKLITKIVLSCKGLSTDWSSYNTAMLILTCSIHAGCRSCCACKEHKIRI